MADWRRVKSGHVGVVTLPSPRVSTMPVATRHPGPPRAASTVSSVSAASTSSSSSADGRRRSLPDDAVSCYSHASAVELPALDASTLRALLMPAPGTPVTSDTSDRSDDARAPQPLTRCSFAESFARRARRPAQRPTHDLALVSIAPRDLIARAADALAELLDDNSCAAERLTDSTRAFAAVFSRDEKVVLGYVISAAVGRARRIPRGRGVPDAKLDTTSLVLRASSISPTSMAPAVVAAATSRARMGKAKKLPEPALTQCVLLGAPDEPQPRKRNSMRMSIRPSRPLAGNTASELATISTRSEYEALLTKGPLVVSQSDESIDVQLPFCVALLAILGAMARLDCAPHFKRRRGRLFEVAQRAVFVNVRTQPDRHGRAFGFSVSLSGSSPCRLSFRRPRFISMWRVDDYVDTVFDTKDFMTDFCETLWGRA